MSLPSVLHVLARPGGGAGRYVRALSLGLTHYEHRHFLLTDRRTPIKRPPLAALARLLSLRQEARRHQLLHVHGAPALLLGSPAVRSQPTILTTHGLSLLHEGASRRRIAGVALRMALRREVRVIAVSRSDRDALVDVAPGCADSTTVIHTGVEPDAMSDQARQAIRRELGIADSTVALLFVGELAAHKQPMQLVEAIQAARDHSADVVGMLVGEGALRRELERVCGAAVSLLGERDDIETLLAGADGFVLPSLHEGLSLALLEAMASAKPVIVSDVPPNREAIGEAGIAVPAGDVSALSEAIVRLASDPALRGRLGAAAKERADERFAVGRMLEETAEVYDRALSSA